jgi:hypothetical protein
VSSREASKTVEEDHNVFSVFDDPLGTIQNHVSHFHVTT